MDHPIKRPSYDEHIGDLFTDEDDGCMSWALDLTSYEGVKRGASKISEWIGAGRMPPEDTGRQWSDEKLETFRNWVTNTAYAEKSFVRIKKPEVLRVRKNILDIEKDSDEYRLLKKAFEGIKKRDPDRNDPSSYFNLAGIHWLPGPIVEAYCRHHDDAYNPWHRAYLLGFENALRSVEGCAEVTLPYWDIQGGVLPGWIDEAPFEKYAYAHEFRSTDGTRTFEKDADTIRHSVSDIHDNVQSDHENIGDNIDKALVADVWKDFNGWSTDPFEHKAIIKAHDNGHGACGETISNPEVAAFDPLFWFFHCNWDRLWWQWQTKHHRTSLLSFKDVVEGDTHWLTEAPDTLLSPFDVNSAEVINLKDWNIEYLNPPERELNPDELLVAARGNIRAESSFRLQSTEQYSVRIKDINRLDIPGSFEVVLYAGDTALKRTRIFQPPAPRECPNCQKHGIFSTDFIIDRESLMQATDLRVAIEVKNEAGDLENFPLENAGNPTLNIRLLLNPKANL